MTSPPNVSRRGLQNLPQSDLRKVLDGCASLRSEPQHQRWIEKAAESVRFEVYCAKARHIGWAIDGWHVL